MIVYICSDSFGSTDPDYGAYSWVDLLTQDTRLSVVNLSVPGASNLRISLQVQEAIKNNADFIIYNATSSIRGDISVADKGHISFTIPSLHVIKNSVTKEEFQLLKDFYSTFFDLNLKIKENHIIIEGTLSMLEQSKINYLFSQGGFEHPKFSGAQLNYFLKYKSKFSKFNLWDFVDDMSRPRPWFHITDRNIHKKVAEYYLDSILNHSR